MTKVKNEKEQIVTVMFADIEDSTGISNYFNSSDYRKFLSEFHKTIQKVLKNPDWKIVTKEINHKLMGDEFIAFFPHKEYKDKALEHALKLAATLKYEWLFSKHNQGRLLEEGKENIDLNIGINTGEVSLMQHPILSDKVKGNKYSYEGFPITMAKRIQGVASESHSSRIIVADRFYREYSKLTNHSYQFHYIGQRSFKGIAQRFSCYEWLGNDFWEYIDFEGTGGNNVLNTLNALCDKNPHNPWFALLIASYYFALAEIEYYKVLKKGESPTASITNQYYAECEKVCIKAIHSITNYNLRTINEILFSCLEVEDKFEELCFRSEQAFDANPTFEGALALYAKSLFMQNEPEKAKKEANKLLVLFNQSLDYESLFFANFILARYYAKTDFVKSNVMKYLKSTVSFAKKAKLKWAYSEYMVYESDFENVKDSPEFKQQIKQLEKLS